MLGRIIYVSVLETRIHLVILKHPFKSEKNIPPLWTMYHLTHIFVQSITIAMSILVCWNKEDYYIWRNGNVNPFENITHKINYVSSSSKNTSTLTDNPLLIPSKYHILQYLSIKTSDLKINSLRVMKLQNIMKEIFNVLEDNEISMNVDSWGGRGRK